MGLTRLNANHRAFCDNFILTGDVYESQVKAGFSPNNKSYGSQLLKDKLIREYIEKNKNEIAEIVGISKLKIVNKLKSKAFVSITDIFNDDWTLKPLGEMSEEVRDAIKSIEIKDGEVKVVLHDQIKASEVVLKSMGWNEPEKVENTVKIKKPLILNVDGKELNL